MKIGELAPDFILKDQQGKDFKISENRGKRVLLSFHPLAWTDVCAKQMVSLEANYIKLLSLNAIPVGISVDSVPCKEAWAKSLGLQKLRILADFWPHGGVATSYGLFRERHGTAERANVIVDENGKVSFIKVYPISELPDIEEILKIFKK
jgi:peroxiredoxin